MIQVIGTIMLQIRTLAIYTWEAFVGLAKMNVSILGSSAIRACGYGKDPENPLACLACVAE